MAPPDEREDADPGLARERTELSWARTAIAFAAVGAAILKRQPVAGLIVLAITPVIWGLGRVVARGEGEEHGPRARRLLLVTVIVTMVAVLAVIVALLGHGPTSLRDLLPLHG
jgi:uncharacterized membrane protein YidH (DUF202 family)